MSVDNKKGNVIFLFPVELYEIIKSRIFTVFKAFSMRVVIFFSMYNASAIGY